MLRNIFTSCGITFYLIHQMGMAGLIRLPLHIMALSRPPAYYSNGYVRSIHSYKVVCVYARVTDNMPFNSRVKRLWKYFFS